MPVLAWVVFGVMGAMVAIFAWLDWPDRHRARQRATAKRYEERCSAAYKQAAEVAGAFQLGYDTGRRQVMGGYKTVKASRGWQFEITMRNGAAWHCREYCVDADGSINWMSECGQCSYQFRSWETIELVEIAKPEPEAQKVPQVKMTVYCPTCGWQQDKPLCISWRGVSVEEFICENPKCDYTHVAQPEPNGGIYEWELYAVTEAQHGDWLQFSGSSGKWQLFRPNPQEGTHRLIADGQAMRKPY